MTTQQINSSTGAGEQSAGIQLSAGWYLITMANIYADENYAQEAHLGFDVQQGDGTYVTTKLISGYVSHGRPLCLACERRVQGPARIYSTVYHLASATHMLQVQVLKIQDVIQ